MKVLIVNNSKHELPKYQTPGSAGMDVCANIDEPITIEAGKRAVIPTGLHVQLPQGYELQLRPRSGLALKHGITLANTPGTIDSDYRGDIGVIIINLGESPFTIYDGDRICQMVITNYTQVEWEQVSSLEDSERGDGGFGHTGVGKS
jgi:dUTP pyrophosphatase